MRKIGRISKAFAGFAAGIVGLSLMIGAAGARTKAPSSAAIQGPATVESGSTCYWTASTDIANPIYEWEGPDGIIGTGPSVSYVYYRINGAHQLLDLTVHNDAGDRATAYILVGVYNGVGTPDCQ